MRARTCDPLFSIDDRVELHSHAAWVAETCVAQVDAMFRLGGASALDETSVLQRCWRDLNALVQHMYFDAHFHEVAASCALGLAAEPRTCEEASGAHPALPRSRTTRS